MNARSSTSAKAVQDSPGSAPATSSSGVNAPSRYSTRPANDSPTIFLKDDLGDRGWCLSGPLRRPGSRFSSSACNLRARVACNPRSGNHWAGQGLDPLPLPMGLAVDAAGDRVVVQDNRTGRIDPSGVTSTVAGKGMGSYRGDRTVFRIGLASRMASPFDSRSYSGSMPVVATLALPSQRPFVTISKPAWKQLEMTVYLNTRGWTRLAAWPRDHWVTSGWTSSCRPRSRICTGLRRGRSLAEVCYRSGAAAGLAVPPAAAASTAGARATPVGSPSGDAVRRPRMGTVCKQHDAVAIHTEVKHPSSRA